MEIGAAAAGVSAGVQALWGYNRKNFLFDREMRQKQEYQVLNWRSKQAALWREDIKDIIGLTEKKMDTYTIVAALQLGMCVPLFTEGRLEPGTPPWLLHFYMLTLAAAFLYLLMAVWLAMHASIVAQCSEVRLLTQFVRLPVPTWQQLEAMRTYAQSYEQMSGRQALRVPFFGQSAAAMPEAASPAAASQAAASQAAASQAAASQARTSTEKAPPAASADPWGWEQHGEHRDIYELKNMPVTMRRHITLAQRAAEQYKCYDAFSRVAMTFGTNQLLQAVTYYCLGYVCVQDGAPWASWCVGVVMATISVAMVQIDVSLTRNEQLTAQVLGLAGPVCASCATWLWARHGEEADQAVLALLPLGYASHGLWLLWALKACGVTRMPCGSVLPLRFRAVLYLDVFGWLSADQDLQNREKAERDARGSAQSNTDGYHLAPVRRLDFDGDHAGMSEAVHLPECPDTPDSPRDLSQLQEDVREHIALWQSEKVQRVMDEQEKARVDQLVRRFTDASLDAEEPKTAKTPGERSETGADGARGSASGPADSPSRSPWVKLHGYSDFGLEAPYLYDPDSGEVADIAARQQARSQGSSGVDHVRTITFAEEEVERFCTHAASAARRAASPASQEASEPKRTEVVEKRNAAADALLCCSPERGSDCSELRMRNVYSGSIPEEEELQPSGPSGAISVAPPRAFAPVSFLPSHDHAGSVGESEIVTGHDRLSPGELPWNIFRSATLLIVALWAVALATPFEPFRELMTKPLLAEIHVEGKGKGSVEHFAVGTDPSGLPEYIPEPDETVPELDEGELIKATWPSHSGFTPRALSSAQDGKQLVVADDFGVYAGRLSDGPARGLKSLRGGVSPIAEVNFTDVPRCIALEGKALKDISVVCSGSGSSRSTPSICRLLVLHSRGRRLVDCPLFGEAGARRLMSPEGQTNFTSWAITTEWLHGHSRRPESVESVAVNDQCLSSGFRPSNSSNAHKVGCIVVGTTSGRIVQLRAHVNNKTRLVPERAVQQWSQAVEHGSLHLFPNGRVLALHKRTSSLKAFDTSKGKSVGRWRLPRDVEWMMLSGEGRHLYLLGRRRNGTEVQLHRFPAPKELLEAFVERNNF